MELDDYFQCSEISYSTLLVKCRIIDGCEFLFPLSKLFMKEEELMCLMVLICQNLVSHQNMKK